jgi:hypothetical protein
MQLMALKVSELIELLQKCPPDIEVDMEGCDCTGEAVDVDHDERWGTVTITRSVVDRTPPKEPEPEPPNTGAPSLRWKS